MGSNAGGFDFELVKRNAMLQAKGVPPPKAWKTGTTIAGVIYKVLAGPLQLHHLMRLIQITSAFYLTHAYTIFNKAPGRT